MREQTPLRDIDISSGPIREVDVGEEKA